MNYSYPVPGSQVDPTSFVANTTGELGSYDKAVDDIAFLTVDYSKLVVSTIVNSYSIRVSPGGEPQLAITGAQITTGATTPSVLQFTLAGGIAGRAYTIAIIAQTTTHRIRTDKLTVNVLGDDDCGCITGSMPYLPPPDVSADGRGMLNDAPRLFVSSTAPVQPQVLDRWYHTTTGNVFEYISDGRTGFWLLSIAFGGNSGGGGPPPGGGGATNIITIDPIAPDGTSTVYNLTASVPVLIAGSNTLFVSLDGVWQQPVADYVANGPLIQFTAPPTVDAQIFMLWFAPPSGARVEQ